MSAVECVSVVLPTKYAGPGRAEEKAPLSIEIVAIALGSRDDTLATLRTFAVRVHENAPAGFAHGETRNLAARLATGDGGQIPHAHCDIVTARRLGTFDTICGALQHSACESVPFSRTGLGAGARAARRCRA